MNFSPGKRVRRQTRDERRQRLAIGTPLISTLLSPGSLASGGQNHAAFAVYKQALFEMATNCRKRLALFHRSVPPAVAQCQPRRYTRNHSSEKDRDRPDSSGSPN